MREQEKFSKWKNAEAKFLIEIREMKLCYFSSKTIVSESHTFQCKILSCIIKRVLLDFTHSCYCDHMWSWCQSISPLCVSCPKWRSYSGLPRDLVYEVLLLISTIIFCKNFDCYIFVFYCLPYWNNEIHWPLLLNYHRGRGFSWINLFKVWTSYQL